MDDISALFLLRHRKSLHESLEINFKDDSQEFFLEASQMVDETEDVLKSVVGYTNAIKDEVVAIRDVVQSFLVNISNKMSTILSTSVQKYDDFTETGPKSETELKDTIFSQQKADLLKEMETLATQQQHLQEVAYSVADLLIGVEKGSLDVMDNLQKTLKVFAIWKNCIDGTEVSHNAKPGNDVAKKETSSKEPIQQETKPFKVQEEHRSKLENEKSTLETQTKSRNENEVLPNSSDTNFKDEEENENDTQHERKDKEQRDENEKNEIEEHTHESNFKETEINDVKPQTGLQVTSLNDTAEDNGGSEKGKGIKSMDDKKEKDEVIDQSKKTDKGLTKKQTTKNENDHKKKNKRKQISDVTKQERKVVSPPVAGQTNVLSSSKTVHKPKTSKSTSNNETSATSKSQQRAIKSRTPDNNTAETQEENRTEGSRQKDQKSKSANSSLKADLQRTYTPDGHLEKRETWIDLQRKKEEMEKKKEEKEKERRNPQNWLTYTYEREPNEHSFHKGICCIVSALPGFDRFCLTTKYSDHPQDLEIFLKDKEERVMSSVVTVTSTTRSQIELELPLYIYIPCAANKQDQERELVLLMSLDGSPFRHATKLQPLNPPKKTYVLGNCN